MSEHAVGERPTIPVRLAWRRYLAETSPATAKAYELVEQLAWQRLPEELTRLGRSVDVASDQP